MREMAENDKASGAEAKVRGRPRDPAVEKAILRATVERFASDGYSRMTIGDIATDAGVTRPTVYRRWANKHDLVVDALDFNYQEERERNPIAPLEELPPAEALRKALEYAAPFGASGRGMTVIGNVLAEAKVTPGLVELVRRHAVAPRVQPLIDTLRRLCKEGALHPDTDVQVIADMMIGSFYSSYLRGGGEDPQLPGRVVAAIWPVIAGQER
ncbi:TetR/AcrR family transcriptional regulator [Streptomyces sp. NPDC087425]|uniref:TetR/AcrR family transcriptional regulator n=1 Tax=Streptomyces sp. NPDC087425 TaxID=3365787 RepID=UPI003822E538